MTQNFCLALRDQGVSTSFTTLLVAYKAAGPRAAGDPRRLHHRLPHRRRLSGARLPHEASSAPGRELAFVDTFGASLTLRGAAGG
jgi:hypothetical protein